MMERYDMVMRSARIAQDRYFLFPRKVENQFLGEVKRFEWCLMPVQEYRFLYRLFLLAKLLVQQYHERRRMKGKVL